MNHRLLTAAQRIEAREFSIPAGARRVTCKKSGALVVLFPFGEKAAVKAFQKGAARPSFFYTFRTEEKRDTWAAAWLKGQADRADAIAARKAQRKAFVHTLEVGAILYSSWGYDQTNVDFYQVVEVAGKSVVIREIKSRQVEGSAHIMGGQVVAAKDSFAGEPMRKLVGEGNCVRIASYASASPWDGRPKSYSCTH